ncbi:MAG: hypothetical protein IJT96_06895 [Lachnospiraceae bacterium]|nr:hypothetical protein [Lachnospiraceae bacterium]
MNLYYELLQYPVFSIKDVNLFYSSEKTARTALEKLLKEKMVLKIRKGLYTCVSGENGGPVADRFQIASALTPTSYVSHHSAFEYYGVTDQVVYNVYVSSETRFHDFDFDGYTYHYVRSRIMDGVVLPQFGGGVRVTDKERTLLDSIKDMNMISGIEEVLAEITGIRNIDEHKLLKYLGAFKMAFLYQKTGFIMEMYQTDLNISDAFINECRRKIGNSKRYITNDITNVAYSDSWKLVYPRNMKGIKNGEFEYAAI